MQEFISKFFQYFCAKYGRTYLKYWEITVTFPAWIFEEIPKKKIMKGISKTISERISQKFSSRISVGISQSTLKEIPRGNSGEIHG